MLKEKGSKVLGTEITTDEQINYYGWGNPKKPLKIIVVKGFIDDWALYVEAMDEEMSYERVRDFGNKICSKETIKKLIDCDEVLDRYRY